MVCMQDQDTLHWMWVFGHKIVFILHMVLRTLLHKAAPSVFAGPHLIQVVMGIAPYRNFLLTLYKDGILLAGFLTAAVAVSLHIF